MVEKIVNQWGSLVLRGVFAIMLGLLIIIWPTKTLTVTAWLVGLYFLVEGIVVMLSAIFRHKAYEHWFMEFLKGAFTLFLGVVIAAYPSMTIGVLFFFLAIWLLVGGIVLIFQAITHRRDLFSNEWLTAAGGVISILFAMVLLAQPTLSITVATVLVGVVILLTGIYTIAVGMQLRSYKGDLKKLNK
jgi:uncharacterized membrane protein HdeD (DUF308 family)